MAAYLLLLTLPVWGLVLAFTIGPEVALYAVSTVVAAYLLFLIVGFFTLPHE